MREFVYIETMPGLREAGLVGASVAVTGGLVYAVWSYLSASPRRDDNTPTAEIRQRHSAETETRAEPEPGEQPEEPEQDQHGPPGDGDVLQQQQQQQQQQHVVVEAVTAHVDTSEAAAVVESKPVEKGRQVLVLGLDGAGKTSLLHCFSTGALEQDVVPTDGFNAVSINREDLQIEFLEIGGREHLRPYWQKYMAKALVLVFVVDASNKDQFPLARKHLHELLPGSHPQLPLVVLSNKVDLPGACSITELHEHLSLSDVGDQRRLYLIGTSSQSADMELNSGVQDARDLIVQLVCEG